MNDAAASLLPRQRALFDLPGADGVRLLPPHATDAEAEANITAHSNTTDS